MESVTKTPRKQLAKLKFCFTGNVQVCVWLCDAFNFRDFCRCFPLRILMLAIFPTINRRKWFSMSSSVRKMVFYNKTKKRNTKEYVLCITRDEYKKSLVIGFFPPIFVFVRSNGWCGCVCVVSEYVNIFNSSHRKWAYHEPKIVDKLCTFPLKFFPHLGGNLIRHNLSIFCAHNEQMRYHRHCSEYDLSYNR